MRWTSRAHCGSVHDTASTPSVSTMRVALAIAAPPAWRHAKITFSSVSGACRIAAASAPGTTRPA